MTCWSNVEFADKRTINEMILHISEIFGIFATRLNQKWQKQKQEMTQEERWQVQYEQMMVFMEKNHRRPSKYKLEEHDMLNWFKSNKKMMNKGVFPEERLERFRKLLELAEKYRRLNQHDIKDWNI